VSGGGMIIEKRAMTLPETGKEVVRYHTIDAPRSWDETYVYAEPSSEEPQLGESIWWGGGHQIYWGDEDRKRLVKVGYSWSAR
jgi:hypothetical protein